MTQLIIYTVVAVITFVIGLIVVAHSDYKDDESIAKWLLIALTWPASFIVIIAFMGSGMLVICIQAFSEWICNKMKKTNS